MANTYDPPNKFDVPDDYPDTVDFDDPLSILRYQMACVRAHIDALSKDIAFERAAAAYSPRVERLISLRATRRQRLESMSLQYATLKQQLRRPETST